MNPVVLYAAKSTADLKGSIPTQLEDCRVLALREGLTVASEHQDEAASAYSGSRGPGLTDAMAACERLVIEHGSCALIVQHSDRLARGDGKAARHLVEYALWAGKVGVRIASVQDPEMFPVEGELGLLLSTIGGMRNHQDSKRKSESVKSGKRREANRGRWPGGPTPDGLLAEQYIEAERLRHRLVEDRTRSPLVRRIFQDFDAGHSLNVIARALNRDRYRTQRGREWQQRRIKSMLRNPVYAGRVVYKRHAGGVEVREATNVQAIVSPDLFDRVQARMAKEAADRGGRRPSERRGTLALHRLAVCNRCDRPMQTVTNAWQRKDGSQKRKYRCAGKRYDACDAPQVDARRIDAAVVAHLEHLFIDLERWQADLARGAQEARGTLDLAVSDARAALTAAERKVADLGERFSKLDGVKADAVLDLLVAAREERGLCEGLVRQAEDELSRIPDSPPTDEVLDLHSALARIVRGGDATDLNDRLRLVFDRFEIDTLPDGKILVLPWLREDLVERYADPDGYLRVITSRGVTHTPSDAPPSVGPLLVLDGPSTAQLNASA